MIPTIRDLSSAKRRAAAGCAMAVAAVAVGAFADSRSAHAQIVRWNIEATVIQIDGPEGTFPDVRIGDPVRGWMSYHLAAPPDGPPTDPRVFYFHPLSFPLTGMVIENPRSGEELVIHGVEESDNWIYVINDSPFVDDDPMDYLLALQSAVPPPGVAADFPVLSVEFQGLTAALPDASLPLELYLDDWDFATLSFNDLLGESAVYAEIYALTKTIVPTVVGDFNFDQVVDRDDLPYWQKAFESTDALDGDADDDFDADGHDFLVWQRRLSPSEVATPGNPTPEPATLVLLAMGAWAFLARPRVAPSGGWRPRRQRLVAAGMERSN